MHRENTVRTHSGWGWLCLNLVLYVAIVVLLVQAIRSRDVTLLLVSLGGLVANVVVTAGFFVVNPNEAAVILLFGEYKGTCKTNGFRFANPFFTKKKISLKARNLNGDRLKVNDKSGNPVDIAVVVVWQVENTAQAMFDVDNFEAYVTTQSESALRHLASRYAYDGGDEHEITLRGATDEVNLDLQKELQERLDRAGVNVIEARLSHLAYAPEIAHAMLQRQQASAVVAARRKIVDGAVGMVEMALAELAEKRIVDLSPEAKAQLVSNLLVVLCSEHSTQPILNAGAGK
ncbi:MAG TPA: SPFH domain-containing protein [Candidatus Krumholzibacteria bacterium]|nr:SPFH domain-containing protein [Candidatus Krumholzibacteria bacterium]HPD72358.1 SPFH domain-containing protein [Candidatus Krumholzibacteria bacterium]HRY40710.1 SPFH domain-containing protein [Candidatus Krumholzibacteria bacterium]